MNREELIRLAGVMARPYRLCPPERLGRGLTGAQGGSAAGQSIDFHDFREYQPGDDLRRVDWRAYARTGQLHLKLFREEVSPVVEITLDASASMDTLPGKSQAAVFIAAFLAGAARAVDGRPVLRHGRERHAGQSFETGLAHLRFGGTDRSALPPAGSGTGAGGKPLRFWIGDFLMSDGLEAAFKGQAAGTLLLTPVMVLAASERHPPWDGGWRLIDAENPERVLDVAVTPETVEQYRRRLRRHEDEVAGFARRHGGQLTAVDAPDQDLDEPACAELARALAREGLVSVA